MNRDQQTISIVYTTAALQANAEKLAENAVSAKYAACVNIIPSAISIYEWEGKIEKTQECLLIFKTAADKMPLLIQWLKQNHPYSLPAILSAEINTTKEFLDYVGKTTESAR